MQVVLDGARADEQLGSDLAVRQTVTSKLSDLPFLGGQLRLRVIHALAHLLPGDEQLALDPRREGVGAHGQEQLACGPQLLAGIDAPVHATEPLAVEKVRTGKMRDDARVAEPIYRLAKL